MSSCIFLASDHPLPTAAPSRKYPLEINIDAGTIYDGGADDNYFLLDFPDVRRYTDRAYGVSLEWYYTEGRGRQIIEYIRAALKQADSVELWHIWLMDCSEFEDRPVVFSRTLSIGELTVTHLQQLDQAPIWNAPDKTYPSRPSFYRLIIVP